MENPFPGSLRELSSLLNLDGSDWEQPISDGFPWWRGKEQQENVAPTNATAVRSAVQTFRESGQVNPVLVLVWKAWSWSIWGFFQTILLDITTAFLCNGFFIDNISINNLVQCAISVQGF